MNADIFLSKPGVLCSAGTSLDSLWETLHTKSQAHIKKTTAMTGDEYFAARIPDETLKPATGRYDMKIIRMEETALLQIEKQILEAKEKYGAERVALCIGSCDNGTQFSIAGHKEYFANGNFPESYSLEMQGADYVATFAAEKYGLKGPAVTMSTACSSSACAIIKAAELLMGGVADAVIAGGIDIASDTTLVGFNSLGAVSETITNPFSKNRHGITLGDGAAFFVITKEPLSSNDCKIDIKLLGFGESADAYHMTSPDPSGDGARKSMERALKSAGLSASNIDYVNLHGTGTKFNDSMESKALDAVFKDYKVPAGTTKATTGHTLGAAAALELAICWKAIYETFEKGKTVLPPQIWDGVLDEELPVLNFIKDGTEAKVNTCLSNSFAFGGANATLIIGK